MTAPQHRYARTCGADDLARLARRAWVVTEDGRYVAGRRRGYAEGRSRGWSDMIVAMVAGALIGAATYAAYWGW